jgi:lipopolysaccharide/colanic/teichoic acid biosynthesis glycosyltransferase
MRGFRGVHSVEQFRAIVERERARADRNGHQFSVVVFDAVGAEANSAEAQHLARVLTKRIRFTDQLGWFDSRRIAVLLPETPAAGAWKLAKDARTALSTDGRPPECNVYTYPSRRSNYHCGHSERLRIKDVHPKSETSAFRSFPISAKAGRGARSLSDNKGTRSGQRHSTEEVAEPMQRLFCRPLPLWKRAMDVVGTSLCLVIFSPLMLLAALIIKSVSPGPVFFKQDRAGYGGRPFTMWKFRTMEVGADTSTHQEYVSKLIRGSGHNGRPKPMIKLSNESHVIPLGRMLRRTYIDELPQLINVLRGEMSLVGPRPPILYELEEYQTWHYKRIDVVPGMTGLWQVSGKNRLSFDEMMRLDIRYWRQKSPWLDIRILLTTPLAIVSQLRDSMQNG